MRKEVSGLFLAVIFTITGILLWKNLLPVCIGMDVGLIILVWAIVIRAWMKNPKVKKFQYGERKMKLKFNPIIIVTALIIATLVILVIWMGAFVACYNSSYACADPSEVPGWIRWLLTGH
jgi:hypothetical protein